MKHKLTRIVASAVVLGIAVIAWALVLMLCQLGVLPAGLASPLVSIFWVLTMALWLLWLLNFAQIRIRMVKRQRMRRKYDRMIIQQAKALGVWDKLPIVLGGRALELKASEDYKINRLPGETDEQLRRRYMASVDIIEE